MTRTLFALTLLATLAPAARAQDMPLSQILIDGEGWKKVEGKLEKPRRADPEAVMGLTSTAPDPLLAAAVRSVSGDTIFVCSRGSRVLWAFPADSKGIRGKGASYGLLRAGSDGEVSVGGLVADKDGRIYALTELGVQVFDPSGRLCGVLTPAATGRPEHLAFEGDELTHWIGDTKYSRKLNTNGAK